MTEQEWLLQKQNDLRAMEYDEKRTEENLEILHRHVPVLVDVPADDTIERAVKSARVYNIDEETIAVGLDIYDERGLDEMVSFFADADRMSDAWYYRILPWSCSVSADVEDICMADYFRGSHRETVSTEIWGQLDDIIEALMGDASDFYEFSSEGELECVSDGQLEAAITGALLPYENRLLSIQNEYEHNEEGEVFEELPRVFVALSFEKEVRLPEENPPTKKLDNIHKAALVIKTYSAENGGARSAKVKDLADESELMRGNLGISSQALIRIFKNHKEELEKLLGAPANIEYFSSDYERSGRGAFGGQRGRRGPAGGTPGSYSAAYVSWGKPFHFKKKR